MSGRNKKAKAKKRAETRARAKTLKSAATDSTSLFKLQHITESKDRPDASAPKELYNHTATLIIGAAAALIGSIANLSSIYNLAGPSPATADLVNLGIGLFFTASGLRSMAYAHDADVVEEHHLKPEDFQSKKQR
ncbi:MAG: hypothetical protein P1U34_07895 [Coxiellaceae bacterium]|nr:hypothetical protein [Coxiellaceae bacterium]